MTEFDAAHHSRNSHHPSHLSLDEGIRINREPMVSNHRPQWRPPFAHDTPETWQAPHPSPVPTPELYPFRFPARQLSWTPHPYPHSYATAGWDRNTVFGQSTPQRPAPPPATAPVQQQSPGPYTATHQSGRRSPWLPGATAVVSSVQQWSPGTWPPLMPSPGNSNIPQIERDVSRHPTTARRLTSAHGALPLNSRRGWSTGAGIDQQLATSPAFDRISVRHDVGLASQLWGPIVIERPVRRVTILDLLECIYVFFHKHLTHIRKATSSLLCLRSSAADD
ncbi:hypothetical protein EDC04DRAFT_2766788 [Pisolithus marmoratus]|nr:hypothetical protein EDC04DRAFT_2766788 [Pisolithus marmoratus]